MIHSRTGTWNRRSVFIDVGRAVMNPVTALKYNARVRKAIKEIQTDVCLHLYHSPGHLWEYGDKRIKDPYCLYYYTVPDPCSIAKAFHTQ